jgi:hypothetical protein
MLHTGVLRPGWISFFSRLPQAAGLEFARTAALLLLPVRRPLRLLLLQPARRKSGFAIHVKFPGHAAGAPDRHSNGRKSSIEKPPWIACRPAHPSDVGLGLQAF